MSRLPEIQKLTYDDYQALPLDDGHRYEILDGQLYVSPTPLIRHQLVSQNLFRILDRHVLEHRLGQLFNVPVTVVLARTTIPIPDLVFVRSDRRSIITEKEIEGPPDLVVEILSPGSKNRDRVLKARLYARYRVREYWIVDPKSQTLEIFELRGRAYRRAAKYAAAAQARSRCFPKLEIDLSEVWP